LDLHTGDAGNEGATLEDASLWGPSMPEASADDRKGWFAARFIYEVQLAGQVHGTLHAFDLQQLTCSRLACTSHE
jgi:hypothetical protein